MNKSINYLLCKVVILDVNVVYRKMSHENIKRIY